MSARLAAAAARDIEAHARDVAALARDQFAVLHDRELALHDAAASATLPQPPGTSETKRATEDRRRAAADRALASEARARALADREHAARDRERAAQDRLRAQADREVLLHRLSMAETDALTGARTRAAGLADLDHEVDRARRMTDPLVVAYFDVVGLKAVNDTRGHSAGGELLQHVVNTVRDHMRSYDLIVRLGGDEFLCAMSRATRDAARTRFRAIARALADGAEPCAIKVGFATLATADSTDALIRRADSELPAGSRRAAPP